MRERCGEEYDNQDDDGPEFGRVVAISNGKVSSPMLRSPRHARSLGIVAVHQELTLADNLTIAQNIWLGHEETRSLGTIDLKKLSIKSTELIKSMFLEFDPTMTVGKLSLSEKQRVEILKALSLNPKLLILDEATSALAENDVERLYRSFAVLCG